MQGEVYNQSICLVIKVAKMYYSDHMSQKKISEILNISPPTVSRLLKRARDEKIIRFDMPDEFKECIYLKLLLCQHVPYVKHLPWRLKELSLLRGPDILNAALYREIFWGLLGEALCMNLSSISILAGRITLLL